MDRGKRKPIKKMMRRSVMLISALSLLLLMIGASLTMLYIRARSKSALISQAEQNLKNTVSERADLVDSKLQRYAEKVTLFADYIKKLYSDPDAVKKVEVPPLSAENKGILVLQPNKISEDIKDEAIAEEKALLGNMDMILYPVFTENEDVITTIYFATESGLLMAYDRQSDIKPDACYNAHETDWYKLAKEQGKAAFTDVYLDSFDRGLTITCVAPFYKPDGSFAGVIGMDILISDLYEDAVAMDLEEDSYAFLVDNKGNVISPKMEERSLDAEDGMDPDVSKKILSGVTGITLSGDRIYFAYSTVSSTDWKFCIRCPEEVVLAPVSDMNQSIVTAILIFAAVFWISNLAILINSKRFADSVTRPIIALGNDAKVISEGNLEHRAVAETNDEIGDLAINFNKMAEELKEYIENLTRVTAEKERIGAELNVATQIQADMLPRIYPAFPQFTEFDIYATMDPAKEVGGDFYDFFLVDQDHLGLVMADVSGKGVPAALFMVIAKTLIKNRAQMGGTPSEILGFVNEQLCDGNEAQLFVTVWFAILDIRTGKGIAANAGHEHPVIKRAGGQYELVVYKHSPAVATMEGLKFREHEFELHPGDTLFVYTDGVPEATNADNVLFGTDRMLDSLNRDPDADLKTLLKNVREDIDGFMLDAPQFDDITMLGLTYSGKTEEKE